MSQSLGCMQLNEKNHVPFLTFPRLDELPYITHAFSTRKGGVSQQEFSSMNLNFNRGDSIEYGNFFYQPEYHNNTRKCRHYKFHLLTTFLKFYLA